ncbi:MAG: hypothetical protein VXW65_07180 [Pseudomonadota bacterium]|nr:hypothetical protein [Pseudomonadota bacterium]
MSQEYTLKLPHNPKTGFLIGESSSAIQADLVMPLLVSIEKNIEAMADLILQSNQLAQHQMDQAKSSQQRLLSRQIAAISRPDMETVRQMEAVAQPRHQQPVSRPLRGANGRFIGANADSIEEAATPRDRGGVGERFLDAFNANFDRLTAHLNVSDQVDPTIGAMRELSAPLKMLGSVTGSPSEKKQLGLAQRTLKFLGAWRKESKMESDETQKAIAATANRQAKSSLLNGLRVAALAPFFIKALAVTIAAKAGQAIGEKANEVLGSTETGQKVLNWVGEKMAHVAAAFGNEEAKAAIAENLRVEQEQLAEGVQKLRGIQSGASKPTDDHTGGALGRLIGSGEGDYNSYNQGSAGDSRNKPKIDLSNMTVAELMRRQALPEKHKDRIFAAGKYQTIPSTTREAVSALKIDPNQKFTPELQERIFAEYLTGEKRKHLQAYRAGVSNDETAAGRDLALEFASVALPKGMKTQLGRISDGTMTYYDKKGRNRASITADRAVQALRQDRANAMRQSAPTMEAATVPAQVAAPITTPATQNRIENFKPIQMKAEDTIQPAPKLRLPKDAAGLAEHAEKQARPSPHAQQSRSNQRQSHENWYDQHLFKGVGQNVEDRLIAHAVTGGIGWKG